MRFLIMIVIGSLSLPVSAQHLKSKSDSSWIVIHSPDGSHQDADIAVYDLVPYHRAQAPHFPPMTGGFAIERPVIAYIHFIGKEYFEVMIIPGDTLHVHVQQDTLAFEGRSAEINRFRELKRRQLGDYTTGTKMFGAVTDSIPIDTAVKRINEYEAMTNALLNAFEGMLPQWFKERERAHNSVQSAFYRIIAATKRNISPDLTGIDILLNESSSILYDDETYYFALNIYMNSRFPDANDLVKKYKETSAHLSRVIRDPYIIEMYKSFWITFSLSYSNNLRDWQEKEEQWNVIKTDIKDIALNNAINSAFTERKAYLQSPASLRRGTEVPAFSGVMEDGRTITQNDLKGSWVYLTIWGTWCVACRTEIPDKNKLADTYKLVKVVNICGRSKDAEWRKMIAHQQIAGLNLYADNAASLQIAQGFKLSGYPHHVLISPDGKIYENGTLNPSKVPVLLDKLLYQLNANNAGSEK